MREEVAAAVVFLTRLVKRNEKLSSEKVDQFSHRLSSILVERFRDHWYTNTPSKGQAYRCIRISETGPEDPILAEAASACTLRYRDLQLPLELTLWIDPAEVTCRFGEKKGSICTVASFKYGAQLNHAHSLDISQAISQHQHSVQADYSKLQLIMQRRASTARYQPARGYSFSPSHVNGYIPPMHHPGFVSEEGKHKKFHARKNGFSHHVAGRNRRDRFHWVKNTVSQQQPVHA